MRFYSNENFPLPVVEKLRELGHDVLTSAEAGNANKGIPDEEVLRYAMQDQRILLTLNRHDFNLEKAVHFTTKITKATKKEICKRTTLILPHPSGESHLLVYHYVSASLCVLCDLCGSFPSRFIILHGRSAAHAGIVVCTFDADFPAQAGRIDAALRSTTSLTGQLVRVNRAS